MIIWGESYGLLGLPHTRQLPLYGSELSKRYDSAAYVPQQYTAPVVKVEEYQRMSFQGSCPTVLIEFMFNCLEYDPAGTAKISEIHSNHPRPREKNLKKMRLLNLGNLPTYVDII